MTPSTPKHPSPPDSQETDMSGQNPKTHRQAFTVAAGQYVTARIGSRPFATDDLGLVTEVGARVTVMRAAGSAAEASDQGESWIYELDEFFEVFKMESNGLARLQALIAEATTRLSPTSAETSDLATAVAALKPGMGSLGSGNDHSAKTSKQAASTSSEMTIQLSGKALSAESAKKEIASMRNAVARVQRTMLTRRRELEALLAVQAAALEIQLKGLQLMVAGAEDLITTINLYLGKTLQVEHLRKGKPASKDTPVTINQLVLYMDEECAVGGHEGGIDVEHLDIFTDWLLEPENLERVFPHPKGILAFHVRRHRKEYANPWEAMAKDEPNTQNTWFLIRNGGRLDWLTLDISVGTHLVPHSTEFDELFWSTSRPFGKYADRTPLDPGSEDYLKAIDQANAKQRHYMRIAVFLQGLFDRTELFAPLPDERINVLNPSTQGKFVRLNLDGETAHQIADGRPVFRDWQMAANKTLDVGHRVIGVFNHWTHGVRNDWDRVRPWKAPKYDSGGNSPRIDTDKIPASDAIHTIAAREGSLAEPAFVIRYPRIDQVWSNAKRDFVTPSTGASIRVYASDSFILDIDAVTEADIDYYLSSRRHRHEYEYMWPVLRLAREAKQAERDAEAPFRRLLAGELIKVGADTEKAESIAEELGQWWKFKSSTHRALLADDAKALRMILSEFRQRQKRTAPQVVVEREAIVASLGAKEPDAIVIAHERADDYVVFVPENSENIFVRQSRWTRHADGWTHTSETRWQTVDHRRGRLDILHAAPRWSSWRTDVRPGAALTDSERNEVIKLGWDVFASKVKTKQKHSAPSKGRHTFKPLATRVLPTTGEIRLYAQTQRAYVAPAKSKEWSTEPELAYTTLRWSRAKDSFSVKIDSQRWDSGIHTIVTMAPWEPEDDQFGHLGEGAIVWEIFPENVAIYKADLEAESEATRVYRSREDQAYRIIADIHEEAVRRQTETIKAEWLEEGNDEDLWEEHMETLKRSRKNPLVVPHFNELQDPVMALLAKKGDISGMTVEEIVKAPTGKKGVATDEADLDDSTAYPLDFVIPSREVEEQEDEEDGS